MQGSAVEPIELNLPGGGTAILLKPGKDSKWLTLEVCRDFARGSCPRTSEECKYAHPPPHVESQNGRVVCCFDSIKSKCQRTTPPCKYLHPPAHLKDQLLETGRQNLVMKNLQLHSALSSLVNIPQTPQYPLVYNNSKTVPVLSNGYGSMILANEPQYMATPGQFILQGNTLQPVSNQYQFFQNPYSSLNASGLQNCVQFVPLNNSMSLNGGIAINGGLPLNSALPRMSINGALINGGMLNGGVANGGMINGGLINYQIGGGSTQFRPVLTQYMVDAFNESVNNIQLPEYTIPTNYAIESTENAAPNSIQINPLSYVPLEDENLATSVTSRKRSSSSSQKEQLSMNADYSTLIPPFKKAALIDPKNNMPIYQPLINQFTSPLQHFTFASLPALQPGNQASQIAVQNTSILQKYQ